MLHSAEPKPRLHEEVNVVEVISRGDRVDACQGKNAGFDRAGIHDEGGTRKESKVSPSLADVRRSAFGIPKSLQAPCGNTISRPCSSAVGVCRVRRPNTSGCQSFRGYGPL